jgi:PAS domain S-box-containing protein
MKTPEPRALVEDEEGNVVLTPGEIGTVLVAPEGTVLAATEVTVLAAAKGTARVTAPTLTPLRALVLEDFEDDVLVLERHLRRGGYELDFERVQTPGEFAVALDREEWDAVFAPGDGALAALKVVQERELDIPFIIVAGDIGEDTAVEAIKAGAHDFVLKSNLARLAPAVERELRESRQRQDRRRAQKQIALQSAALGAAANLILIANAEGRIEWVNDAFVNTTGYARDEAVGETLQRLASGQDPDAYRKLWDVVSAGENWRGELVERRKDGSFFPVMQTITPLKDEEGTITHVLAIQEDVTEARRALDALGERSLELERSNRELEEFAYIASHDLSAPLRVIAGYLELFLRRHGEQVDEPAKLLLETAVSGAERMQRLIDDLLLYGRASRDPLELADVDTAEVLREVIEDFSTEIAKTEADIRVGPLPQVRSVYAPLSQVLHNLVGNSLKFANGIRPRIEISAARRDGDWRFSVRDNGIGIDPRHVETAFRMFQRLHGAKYPGTGMGLALSKRIVQRLGGEIWHEPAPEEGSIFNFTIPDVQTGSP